MQSPDTTDNPWMLSALIRRDTTGNQDRRPVCKAVLDMHCLLFWLLGRVVGLMVAIVVVVGSRLLHVVLSVTRRSSMPCPVRVLHVAGLLPLVPLWTHGMVMVVHRPTRGAERAECTARGHEECSQQSPGHNEKGLHDVVQGLVTFRVGDLCEANKQFKAADLIVVFELMNWGDGRGHGVSR